MRRRKMVMGRWRGLGMGRVGTQGYRKVVGYDQGQKCRRSRRMRGNMQGGRLFPKVERPL